MRLAQLGQSAVPVTSFRRDRIQPASLVAAPQVGRRWGRPSSFAYSQERIAAADGPGVTIELPDDEPAHFMRIIEAELQVQAEIAVITDEETGVTIEVDRLKRMSFHYTELMPKPTPAHPQPVRTTWYDMEFALHPPADKETTS